MKPSSPESWLVTISPVPAPLLWQGCLLETSRHPVRVTVAVAVFRPVYWPDPEECEQVTVDPPTVVSVVLPEEVVKALLAPVPGSHSYCPFTDSGGSGFSSMQSLAS